MERNKQLSEKEKRQRLKTEKTVLKGIGVILFALAFCYTIYEIYDVSRQGVVTRTAVEHTIYETLDMEVFIIRDEKYIEGSPSGTVVPLVGDGERVAGDADIAAVFKNDDDAAKYIELQRMKKDLARYDSLTSQATFSGLKVGTLEADVKAGLCDFLGSVYGGDMASAFECANDFRDKATTLEIVTKGTLDLTERRQALAQKIASLEASLGGFTMVGTGNKSAGFYMSETDGFENTPGYAEASKLTPAIVNNMQKAKSTGKTTGLGKLVCGYRWYMAAVLDSKKAADIVKGSVVTINLPESDVKRITAKVYAKNEDKKGKTAVIFVCSDINPQILRLRREKAELVMKAHTGFVINSGEIRVIERADGTKINGVYILRGNIVSFRRINMIYSGNGFILSGSTSQGGYVKLYDEIITSGRNLRDGAVVYD